MGVKALRKIQIGKESVAGTGVAATRILRAMGTLDDQRDIAIIQSDDGILSQSTRTTTRREQGEIQMTGEATFEELPIYLMASVEGTDTGVADGAGSGYIYQFDFPTTSSNSIKTFTVEGGDDAGAEEIDCCFGRELSLNGTAGGSVMFDTIWQGQTVIPTTFTGALSPSTVEVINFQKSRLYIDAIGGTFGTTQVSNAVVGFEFPLTSGWQAVWTGDNTLAFSFIKNIGPRGTLSVTFEHVAAAIAQKVNWRAETPLKVQLKIEGSALASAGTAYTYKTLILNLVGKWTSFDPIGDQNGNDIVAGEFTFGYDATAATAGQIIVVNEIASY